MQINKRSIDELQLQVEFLIQKSDYEETLGKKMREKQKSSSFKGFRIGKVPENLIRKMYGNSLLAESVNEVLGKSMDNFFETEKIEYMGEPILAEDQDPVDLDINQLKDYTFIFDLGLRPQFEVIGVSETDAYTLRSIAIDEKTINDEFEMVRRRAGKQETVEDTIEEKDILTLKAKELDGDELKYEGWETNFSIMVQDIAVEDLKKEVLAKQQGDFIRFDIYNLEKDRDESFVKKHFLFLDENEEKEIGRFFEAEIKEVKRLVPAELEEEFFQFHFGEEVNDEEGARMFIKDELQKFYEVEAKQFLNMNIMEEILAKTEVRLPEAFLRRWLLQMDKNKEMEESVFNKQFETFLKEMKWQLIVSELSRKHQIDVEEEEVSRQLQMRAYNYLNSQMGYADPEMIRQIYDYMMKDKNQYQKAVEELMTAKVLDKVREVIQPEVQEVSLDSFREEVKALNERIKERN